MIGMLTEEFCWGNLGDKKGGPFCSIYSLYSANIANAFVGYDQPCNGTIHRLGLASELGARITLVAPSEC